MNLSALSNALTRFLEADQAARRARKIAPLVKELEPALRKWFAKQGKLFLRALGQFRYRFSESIDSGDWLPQASAAQGEVRQEAVDALAAVLLEAMVLGAGNLMAGLGLPVDDQFGISFSVNNPAAVDWARRHAAELVTKIDETTRSLLNTIITNAVASGWSYDRLAAAIADLYEKFGEERSRRIAVYELGAAYEQGNLWQARQLAAEGLQMEKGWLTVGDDRVRPQHRDNQAQGWIPIEDTFSSGSLIPPSDPGCRCSTLYRRKP